MDAKKTNYQTKARQKKIKSFFRDMGDKILLDIGAGFNPLSKGIKTKKTIRLDGINEFNPDICCDINKGIPLKDESVDVIVAGEIIEHIYNTYKFVSECSRVLKEGGMMVLSTPNTCSLKNRFKVLFGSLPDGCSIPLNVNSFDKHVVDFNLNTLEKIFKRNGLRLDSKKTNGIISHSCLLWPVFLTPVTFGETFILKFVKD